MKSRKIITNKLKLQETEAWTLLCRCRNLITGRCLNRPEQFGDISEYILLKEFVKNADILLGFTNEEKDDL